MEPDTSVQKVDDVTELLQKECELWQKKLRLQDWNVEVKVCRLHEMPTQSALAVVESYEERKDAVMHLLAPIDIPLVQDKFLGSEAANYDISIVHELLHLHLLPLSDYDDERSRVAEEQIVNALSRAFVLAHVNRVKVPVPPAATPSHGHYL